MARLHQLRLNTVKGRQIADIEAVLARRQDNGGDYWASADGRLAVGAPFSTLTSLLILHELRVLGVLAASAFVRYEAYSGRDPSTAALAIPGIGRLARVAPRLPQRFDL